MAFSTLTRDAKQRSRIPFASLVIVLAMAFALVPAAFAAGSLPQITGASTDSTTQARFAATGTGTVFATVKQGDKVVAKGLQVTADDKASTLVLNGVKKGCSYNVEFSSKPNGEAEATGMVAPVYAQCGDQSEAIGLHTAIGTDWAEFVAPDTRIVNGVLYKLDSAKGTQAADGTLTFSYTKDESVADVNAVTGTVKFVDQNGVTVRTDKYPNFLGNKEEVTVSSLIFAAPAGKTTAYQVMGLKDGETMQLSYESGQTSFVVYVRELAVNTSEGSYTAQIIYQADGKTLFADTVNVNKTYRYTAPEQFYQKDANGKVQVYKLDSSFADRNPITLEPGNPPEGNKVEVPYNLVSSDESMTWTVQLLNGADGKGSQLAKAYTAQVEPGQTVTYEAKPMKVDGTMYYPAGVAQGKSKTVTYTYGDENLLETVYYVTADYQAKPYNVTVQYVNLADNSIIGKATLKADPDSREDLQINGPAELTVDGEQYVRLAGQDQARRHNFNNPTRTYTVYYRNVKDNLLANATVTHTTVVTTHRTEEVVVPGTASVTVNRVTTPAATTLTQQGPTATVIQRDANSTDADSFSVNNDQGADNANERAVINDDVTPLASGEEGSAASASNGPDALTIGLIAAVLAALAAGFFFLKKRKSTSNGEGGARNE